MLNPEAIPLLNPTARYAFERACTQENAILQASLLIDGQIVDAQRKARDNGYDELPNFTEELSSLAHQAYDALAYVDKRGEGTWVDYYRLVSQTAFLEQRLKVPLAFEQHRYWKERGELANGMYGVSAQIIDNALSEHDSPSSTLTYQKHLRGMIQEQTFLALFNKDQERSQIALPSATYDDLYRKIDAEVWILQDKQAEVYYLPVQIKSIAEPQEKHVTPYGGITIVANEFSNQFLGVSRIIAQEHNHMMGSGEPLTPAQQAHLKTAHKRLFETIVYKVNRTVC
jgi:hypothetical protein